MKRLFTLFAILCRVACLSAESFNVDGFYYESQGDEVSLTSVEDKSCTNIVVNETVTYRNKVYSVTSIGEWAFYQCNKLSGITLPTSITAVKSNAFAECVSLSNIDIPINVRSIGAGAFRGCKRFSSIFIPKNVESVDGSAFSECDNLTQIIVDDSNSYFTSAYGNLYSKDKESLLFSPLANSFNETAFDGIKRIGAYAFEGHTEITSLEIPSNIDFIGEFAFSGCKNLSEVSFADAEAEIEMDAKLFDGCPISKLYFGRNRKYTPRLYFDNRPFSGIETINEVKFGDKVKEIIYNEFKDCSNLSTIVWGSSIEIINTGAFSGCTSLRSINLPENLSRIEMGAFYESGIIAVTLPASVTYLGGNSFAKCKSLSKVILNDAISKIEDDTFAYDSNLVEIDLGKSITFIGTLAFYGCNKLKSIRFPKSLTQFGRKVFCGCGSLETIIAESDSPFNFIEDVFDYATYDNATLYVPTNSLAAYYASYYWNKFKNIVEGMPAGIEGIYSNRDLQESDSYNILGQKSYMQTNGVYVVKRNGGYRKYMKK